jgi:magnesium transporter
MQTASELMTPAVPKVGSRETVAAALSVLHDRRFDEASHLYLVDDGDRLIGQVPIEALLAARPADPLATLQGDPPVEVRPQDRAETVALLAVERHEADVAVLDAQRRLLGAIPIGRLLALLHDEHVDDLLRLAGVGPSHPDPTTGNGTLAAFRARIPWLMMGLAGGMLAGSVAGLFESSLQQEITLAFFLPLVVYMADAVGTQTETVLVRSLAYGRVALTGQLLREAALGLLIGLSVGLLAGAALLLWNRPIPVIIVITLTLAVTSLVATFVASLLPWALTRLGADPALASGPIATVLQDILSVAIYLSIASALL